MRSSNSTILPLLPSMTDLPSIAAAYTSTLTLSRRVVCPKLGQLLRDDAGARLHDDGDGSILGATDERHLVAARLEDLLLRAAEERLALRRLDGAELERGGGARLHRDLARELRCVRDRELDEVVAFGDDTRRGRV